MLRGVRQDDAGRDGILLVEVSLLALRRSVGGASTGPVGLLSFFVQCPVSFEFQLPANKSFVFSKPSIFAGSGGSVPRPSRKRINFYMSSS